MCSSQSAVSDPAAVGRRLVEFTPIEALAKEVRELEEHNRELLIQPQREN